MSSSSNPECYRFNCYYRGPGYYGWQSQPDCPTIQDCLEDTWSALLGTTVSVQGSGRTDRGVHALGQVAHIELREPVSLPFSRWQSLVNERLPAGIGIYRLKQIDTNFHARHSAKRRYYGYRFRLNTAGRNHDFTGPTAWSVPAGKWDRRRARWICEQYNQGIPTGMFSGRGGSDHQSEMWSLNCQIRYRSSDEIWLLVSSRSFRYKMVRCLAGALKRYAAGRWSQQQFRERLKQRTGSFDPAPPDGCYLLDVQYDQPKSQYERAWTRVLNFFND